MALVSSTGTLAALELDDPNTPQTIIYVTVGSAGIWEHLYSDRAPPSYNYNYRGAGPCPHPVIVVRWGVPEQSPLQIVIARSARSTHPEHTKTEIRCSGRCPGRPGPK